MDYTLHRFSQEDQELQEKNIETIIRYFELPGALMEKRFELFENSDECQTGLMYTATGKPMFSKGFDEVRKNTLLNAKYFAVWEWYNIEVYPTGDPNLIFVECDGKGISTLAGRPIEHGDHYIHKFIMRDGKILEYWECMNPCNELLEMGYELPNPQAGWEAEQKKDF